MNLRRLLLLLPALALLGGCLLQPKPAPRFYTLAAVPPEGQSFQDTALVLGVGPVRIPDLLNRPEIVTRLDPQQVRMEGNDFWGGSLKEGLLRVVAEGLGQRLGTKQVLLYPWTGDAGVELQLTLELLALEGTPGGEARLQAGWSLLDGRSRKVVKIGASRHALATKEPGISGLVTAWGRLIGRMTEEIAEEIAAIRQGRPNPR